MLFRFGKPILFLSWCFILFFSTPVCGADIEVIASVNKNPSTLEDIVTFSVIVKGTQKSPTPQLPDLPNFRVSGQSASSTVQIVNGKMTASVTHRYQIIPKNSGTFKLGPVRVDYKGKVYQSNSISLKVEKTSVNPRTTNAPAFALLSVSNPVPFVNEQVVATFKLFRRVDAKNMHLDWQSLKGFRKEDLDEGKQYPQIVNGIKYLVSEHSIALFPARPGPAEIPSAIVNLDLVYQEQRRSSSGDPIDLFFNDPFFGRRQRLEHKIIHSNHVKMKILPLPETNKPKEFSNLVGQYSLNASLGKSEVDAGDTTTLTVTLSGLGNVQDADLKLPELNNIFKVYPDQPQFKKSFSNNAVSGVKTFKFALVPLQEGNITIPEVVISYFDPKKKNYKTLRSTSLELKVNSAPIKESLRIVAGTQQILPSEIRILGKDILPLHTRLEDFDNLKRTDSKNKIFLAGLLLPIFLFLFFYFYLRFQRRLKEDTAFSRARSAYKTARKRLDLLSSEAVEDPRNLAKELSQIVREYIGNKLNLQGTAFTSSEVKTKLREKQFQNDSISQTQNLLETYEMLQFGATGDLKSQNLLNESIELIDHLEKQS